MDDSSGLCHQHGGKKRNEFRSTVGLAANAFKKTLRQFADCRNSNQRRSDHKKREDMPRRDEPDHLFVNLVPFLVPFLPL